MQILLATLRVCKKNSSTSVEQVPTAGSQVLLKGNGLRLLKEVAMPRSRSLFLSIFLTLVGLVASESVSLGQPMPLGTRFTVLPGVSTPVYLNVLPNAVCRLRQADVDDDDNWEPEQTSYAVWDVAVPVGTYQRAEQKFLRLYSDANGYIRLNSAPPAGVSDLEMKLSLRCSANGAREEYRVVLRASENASEDMPFPPAVDPGLNQADATVQPPLVNPDQYTDQELLQLGYPARPNATSNPNGYSQWLALVARPITVLQPQTVDGGIQFTTTAAYSRNWSGFELTPDLGTFGYDLVQAHWIVPSAVGEVFRSSDVAQWVGMDGDDINYPGLNDLVQAGTAEFVLPAAVVGGPMLGRTWNFSTDYAWTEVLPLQVTDRLIKNFPVHPGDLIWCTVWVAWADAAPDSTGGLVFFRLVNDSAFDNNGNPWMITLTTTIATGDKLMPYPLMNFWGKTAEWIVEPSASVENGQVVAFSDLANYQSQCFGGIFPNYNAMHMDATSAWSYADFNQQNQYEYSGRDNYDFIMENGNTPLSLPEALDSHTICFTWNAFH